VDRTKVKEVKVNTSVTTEKRPSLLTQTQRSIIERPIGGFPLREANLTASQKMLLVYRITVLTSYPNIPITIVGHAFDSESSSENLRLGKERADKMKEYLVNNGIAAERITTVSKGDTEPLSPNGVDKTKSANRRVQIIVQ
jgi:outer membrane protein OmpA-like peptidoglycan-associated protein